MIQAYCTALESQTILSNYPDWLALTDEVQNENLSWGRVYIDSLYTCPYDDTNATENIKEANSYAGYMNFKGTLFAESSEVTSTSVTAGTVSSAKTYQSGKGVTTADPMHKQVEMLLAYDCTESSVGGASIGLSRN